MHDVVRLDFSLPPPEYLGGRADGAYLGMDAEQSLATAWAHHKARHDPPGMYVGWEADDKHFDPDGGGEWHICLGGKSEFLVGSFVCWWRKCAAADKDSMRAEARAAAWAWYGRRLALVLALEDVGVQSDLWPVALGWFEEECAAIDAWLLRGPSWLPDDFPEVLRG